MKNNFDKITLAIILYFIQKLDGILGKTHLQKLLFLLNLRSEKRLKKSLVKLEFEKNRFGPYSYKVNDYVENLIRKKAIKSEVFTYQDKSGNSKSYTRYYFNKVSSPKEFLLDNLNPKEVLLVDEVIESYGNISLRDLLDIVYSLPIVRDADYCQPLDVAKSINEEEVPVEDFEDLF